ncbi:MAG: NAD+ synthase [Spirochaetaceae bacterium]
MKVAVGQINTVLGDFEGNTRKILEYAGRAAENGVDLIVFPEMSICGYPPMDLLDYERFTQENRRSLRKLQRELPLGIAAAVGYVDKTEGVLGKNLQNVVSIIRNGVILHSQAKTLLPTYDVFDEARYFEPASERRVYELDGVRVGIAVCEDLWWETEPVPGTRYAVDPVRELLDAGAALILSPSASPFFRGKDEVRRSLLRGVGRSSGVPVVYVNMVGGNDNLIFDGRSLVSDGSGEVFAEGRPFEEDYFEVQLEGRESVKGVSEPGSPSARSASTSSADATDTEGFEELRRALVLGLADYVGKCGFTRVHLGLSGGIDSALVAVLAVQALGEGKVHAFAMPSRYSSEASAGDAGALANNLGIEFDSIPIEPVFESTLGVLAPVLEGTEADVTEENIQARIRGMLMMAYSNKFRSLVLTTGNKSELATGYCTLYGDMAGGLAVIGDLLKTEVYGLCRHINRQREIIPRSIMEKPPSAELRPDQKDEDSLPPYETLDAILELYLLENLSAGEIADRGFDRNMVSEILTLVGRNEYKRRQAPPVLKVSKRAFGTGRRMPVARRIYEV